MGARGQSSSRQQLVFSTTDADEGKRKKKREREPERLTNNDNKLYQIKSPSENHRRKR